MLIFLDIESPQFFWTILNDLLATHTRRTIHRRIDDSSGRVVACCLWHEAAARPQRTKLIERNEDRFWSKSGLPADLGL